MSDYKIVSLPAFTVAGLSVRTSNSRPDQIGKLWQEFYSRNIEAQVPNRKSKNIYSVYIDYERDYTCPYTLIIGCEVEPDEIVPEGLVKKQVPAAKFAVFD